MPVTALFMRLLIVAVPMAVHAGSARMELTVAPGIAAEAEYWPGEADLPAVLLLHGFLATANSRRSTAFRGPRQRGFQRACTPTLSLGMNGVARVACEGHPYAFHGTGRLNCVPGSAGWLNAHSEPRW